MKNLVIKRNPNTDKPISGSFVFIEAKLRDKNNTGQYVIPIILCQYIYVDASDPTCMGTAFEEWYVIGQGGGNLSVQLKTEEIEAWEMADVVLFNLRVDKEQL